MILPQIPEEWAALSSLTCVDLSRNKLNGWLPALLFVEWGRGTRLRQGAAGGRGAGAGKGAGAEEAGKARRRVGSRGADDGAGGGGGYQGDERDGEDAKGDERGEGVVVGQGLRSLSLHHNHFHGPLPDTLRLLKVSGCF